jgi:hypothetical protein
LYFEALGMDLYWHPKDEGEGEQRQVGRSLRQQRRGSRISRMRSAGLQRKALFARSEEAARLKEAKRPPTAKDFG